MPKGSPDRTKTLYPLQKVETVDVSKEWGPELGNPHLFWLARQFTLKLECGHTDVRVKNVRSLDETLGRLPKRIRCKSCPGETREAAIAPNPVPERDPFAVTLVTAALRHDAEHQDELLTWANVYTRWIPDDGLRAGARASVALTLIDGYLPLAHYGKDWVQGLRLREAITAWAENPTDGNRAAVPAAAKRAYGAQLSQRVGVERFESETAHTAWFARRGIIAAAGIASTAPGHPADAILESITWDQKVRRNFYAGLRAKREGANALADQEIAYAEAGYPGLGSESTEQAWSEMQRFYHDNYPTVDVTLAPIMRVLLEVYAAQINLMQEVLYC